MAKRAQERPAPKRLKRKCPSYTEQEKIAACTVLLECGGMTVEAIDNARQLLNSNVSTNTLYKWLSIYKDKIQAVNSALITQPVDLPSVVESTRSELLGKMSRILELSLNRAEETVTEAGYRDVMVGSGIAIDKIRVMSSLTPAVEALLKQLASECRERGTTLELLLGDVLQALRNAPIEINSIEDSTPGD